ncbi:MAG: alpha/beta fold hydrolase [Opitutus sp.]|nr:alpha/beta fold hydrolase [Opitutus sp.]
MKRTPAIFSRVTRFKWLALFALLAMPARAAEAPKILSRDHTVEVRSTVPAIAGQTVKLYLRERVSAAMPERIAGDKVVLFVHGAGTPGSVAFDVPYQDYSWMAFLAAAGYDTFAVDLTGYGHSTRPPAMDDPANLSAEQRKALGVPEAKERTYPGAMPTIASDWDDISAVIAYIRKLRAVERIVLIGMSRGGSRAGGWAAQHPGEVSKLVLLVPGYNRTARAEAPSAPEPAPVFNTQSRAEFLAFWDRQKAGPDHFDPLAVQSVWSEMLASDPVGATWGPGVRRSPEVTLGGWGPAMAKKVTMPTLLVAAEHDMVILPERVRELHADLGSSQKVLVELARSSHRALWERNYMLIFRASLEWLDHGTVNGQANGVVRLGY